MSIYNEVRTYFQEKCWPEAKPRRLAQQSCAAPRQKNPFSKSQKISAGEISKNESSGRFSGAYKVTVVEPDVLHELYQLLNNYGTYKNNLEHLKQTLRNLIKPDSVLNSSFI